MSKNEIFNIFRKTLAGSAALGILWAGVSLIAPDKAQAATCEEVFLPMHYEPTGTACGSRTCPGELYVGPFGHTICFTTGDFR